MARTYSEATLRKLELMAEALQVAVRLHGEVLAEIKSDVDPNQPEGTDGKHGSGSAGELC